MLMMSFSTEGQRGSLHRLKPGTDAPAQVMGNVILRAGFVHDPTPS